jgi:CheY-specific phosphatase CheX
MGITMPLDEQILQQITIQVCQTMLGFDLFLIDNDADSTQQLVSSVEIHGHEHSIVKVFGHEDLVARFAQVMFSMNHGDLTKDEVYDAFREIANMIGGNVKGIMFEDSRLTLPTCQEAHNALNELPDDCVRTTLLCCGYPLTVVFQPLTPDAEPHQLVSGVSVP